MKNLRQFLGYPFHTRPRSRAARRFRRPVHQLEAIEPRLLLSADAGAIGLASLEPLPVDEDPADVVPIDPSFGEGNLLDLIESLPLNDIQNALDHFPIPYVVIATSGDGEPVIANNRAGAPTRVDVDGLKSTGKGGNDLQIEVNTELLPTPHLVLDVERLGEGPFVEDVTILIAFPFDAFTDELLPGASNLFIGFQTTAEDGTAGGHAPLTEQFRFIPGGLGGTEHAFELQMDTVGADNPLRFLAGHFDGDNLTGVLNADAISAYVQDVPASIGIGLDVADNSLSSPAMFSSFGLEWNATSSSLVAFEYAEIETAPDGSSDYGTKLTVDQMPMSEVLSLAFDEDAGTLTLQHQASAPISQVTFEKTRRDGLEIVGTATDVPTEVSLVLDLDPTVEILVNDNTMDLNLTLTREGGITGTEGFFGYPLGYASVTVENVPDMQAEWSADFDQISVSALQADESIGMIEFVIGDDAVLELPPSYGDVPTHHLFSLVDDGTHGTAVGRLLNVQEATLDLDPDASHLFEMTTTQAAPMQAYLLTTPDSMIVGEDAEMTCDIDVIPAGTISLHFDGPGMFGYEAEEGIDQIHCYGHFGSLNFDVLASDLPAVFGFDFDPDEHLFLTAEDGMGGPDEVGALAIRLWDEVAPGGLPGSTALFGVANPLRDARARVDAIPSFEAHWADDAAGTSLDFDTDAANVFAGGIQIAVSTEVELTTPLEAASPDAGHYVTLIDEGIGARKHLAAGAFGIDAVAFDTSDGDAEFTAHYDADSDHLLTVDVDSVFGGSFFPAYDVDVVLTVDDVPHLFDVLVDLDPEFTYTASDSIDEILLTGVVDDSDDAIDNGTEIWFHMLDLPAEVSFVLNPATGATLSMSGPVDLLDLSLSSDNEVFGSGYRLIEVTIEDLPAKMEASWDGEIRLETLNEFDAPTPMGQVNVTISISNNPATNAASLALFDNPGFAVDRSAYQQEIDERYWPDGVEDALNDLYADAEKYDPGEDHVITRGGSDFVSVQFTGFQKIAVTPQAGGGTFEFNAPVAGLHPLFVGLEDGGEFTNIQLENIPDNFLLTVDIPAHLIDLTWTDDVQASIGEIDLFMGPAGANDGDSATRVVLNDTPDQITLSWSFGFPDGAINFEASNEFQLLFLDQTAGGKRLVGGLELQELQVGYDLDLFSFDVVAELDFGIGSIPVAWDLARFTIGVDNSVDGDIAADYGKPGIDGFLASYEFIGSPAALSGGGPAPSGGEFVPQWTFMVKDFRELSVSVGLVLDPVPDFLGGPVAGDAWLVYPLSIDLDFNLVGDFVFDYWSNTLTDWTFTIDYVVDTYDVGFLNEPDYTQNDPFHLWPITGFDVSIDHDAVFTFDGLHDYGDHFDPFA